MVQTTTINIGLRRDRVEDVFAPIYLHFTQNRKTKRLSLGKKVHVKYWTGKTDKWIKERGANISVQFNYHLSTLLFNNFLSNSVSIFFMDG